MLPYFRGFLFEFFIESGIKLKSWKLIVKVVLRIRAQPTYTPAFSSSSLYLLFFHLPRESFPVLFHKLFKLTERKKILPTGTNLFERFVPYIESWFCRIRRNHKDFTLHFLEMKTFIFFSFIYFVVIVVVLIKSFHPSIMNREFFALNYCSGSDVMMCHRVLDRVNFLEHSKKLSKLFLGGVSSKSIFVNSWIPKSSSAFVSSLMIVWFSLRNSSFFSHYFANEPHHYRHRLSL